MLGFLIRLMATSSKICGVKSHACSRIGSHSSSGNQWDGWAPARVKSTGSNMVMLIEREER